MTPRLGILAHRGMWRAKGEQNRVPALLSALAAGFGIETDLRDLAGQVVISHDMPDHNTLTLAAIAAEMAATSGPEKPLALNIKADGLAESLATWSQPLTDRLFFFDMSVPDMRSYLSLGLPCFTRHSDVEPTPAYYDQAVGVWLDELDHPWISRKVVTTHLAAGKRVAVVSGELHRRDHRPGWEMLRPFRNEPRVMICTDLPHEMQEFLA